MSLIDPSLDIVERLSLVADRSDMVRATIAKRLLPEAAGEILRLREQLARFAPSPPNREAIAEIEEEALLADGLEEAYLGVTANTTHPHVCVYDLEECVRILMRRDGMTYEEATEFIEFNTVCAYVGPHTPLYIVRTEPRADAAGDLPAEGGGGKAEGDAGESGVAL